MEKKVLLIGTLIVLVIGALGTRMTLPKTSANGATVGDWPMFMGNSARNGANLSEKQITQSTAVKMHYSWRFTTGGKVVASPAIVGGVMYVGAWDGYEYAINLATHQLVWKQYLGTTTQLKRCYAASVGITSSAAVANGIVYVGGGDGYLYALHTTDGSILWRALLGNPPYYNFSSPLIYNGRVYIGLAAFCDPPYAQGRLLAFDALSGEQRANVPMVPDGQTGATIWSSPSVDPQTNTIFVTTGNAGSQPSSKQPMSEAVVSLDATTLAVKAFWQIPASSQFADSDFGSSPTLFDINGIGYVGALNKNDIYYVFNRNNLGAGPVWQYSLALGSSSVDDNNLSSACYSGGVLYIGAGSGVLSSGQAYGGSVAALNGRTGQLIWRAMTQGPMVSSLTCLSDLVVDNQGSVVEVRSSVNGAILYRHATAGRVEATSVVSDGVLYTPSEDNSVYAFVLAPPDQNVIFQDSFDNYAAGALPMGTGLNQWSQVAQAGAGFGITVSGQHMHSGTNALQVTMSQRLQGYSWAQKNYVRGFATHSARFSFELDPAFSSTRAIPLLTIENQAQSHNGRVVLQLTRTHVLLVVWFDSNRQSHYLGSSGVDTLKAGQWYQIELDQANDPVHGGWSLWLNGKLLLTKSSLDLGNVPMNAIIVGNSQATAVAAGSYYIDDLQTGIQHLK